MAIRSAKRAAGFARGLTSQARINQARSRAGALGYDIRTVRSHWRQTPQEFGVMMGLGLLSAVTVERWELGLEKPPGYVEGWVMLQRNGAVFRRRVWEAHRALGTDVDRVRLARQCWVRLQALGPVRSGRDYRKRARTRSESA